MNITIVGAGIIGVSCAVQLQRRGWKVRLLDANQPGAGCSAGNAGHIATEQVFPLASPQTLKNGPALLLSKDSPFKLQWRQLPGLARWLFSFRRHCGEDSFAHGSKVLSRLNRQAGPAMKTNLAACGLSDYLVDRGHIQMFTGDQASADMQKLLNQLEVFEVKAKPLSAQEISELEPVIKPAGNPGLLYEDTAHVINPFELTQRMMQHFVANGGTFETEKINKIRLLRNKFEVTCDQKTIDCDRLLIAAGADTANLSHELGYRFPLIAERGYHWMAHHLKTPLTRAVAYPEEGFIFTPMKHGLRVAGLVELTTPTAAPTPSFAERLKQRATPKLDEPLEFMDEQPWSGRRPSLPDFLPVLGPSERHENLYFAFGHHHLGLTQSAISGQLLAQAVSGEPPSLDLAPFSPERFG